MKLHIKNLLLAALLATAFAISVPSFAQAQTFNNVGEWHAPLANPFNNVLTDGLASYKVANDPTRKPYANACWEKDGWVALQVVAGKIGPQMPVLSVLNSTQPYWPGSHVYLRVLVQVSNQSDGLRTRDLGFSLALGREDGYTGTTLASLWNNRAGLNVEHGAANISGDVSETNTIAGEEVTRNLLKWAEPSAQQPTSLVLSVDFVVPEEGVWGLHVQGHNGDADGTWATLFVKTDVATFQPRELLADRPTNVQLHTVGQVRNELLNGRPAFRIYDPEVGRLIGRTDPQWRGWVNRITGMYPRTFRELVAWTVYAQFCAGMSGQQEPWRAQLGNSGCVDTIILRSLVEGAHDPGDALVQYTTTLGELGRKLYRAKPHVYEDENNRVDMNYLSLTSKFF